MTTQQETTQQGTTAQDVASRRTDDGTATRRVVVGYDGSPASVEALTWASVEAGSLGARLTVVYAGDVWSDGFTAPFVADITASGGRLAQEGVDRVVQVPGGPGEDRVEAVAVLEDPVTALLEASGDADLLVLGNRGRGRVAGALLGSVAFSVTSRAACPVVVVRGEAGRRPGPGAPVVVGVDDSPGAHDAVGFAADAAARRGARLVVVAAWTVPDLAGTDGYGVGDVAEMTEWARRGASIAADVAAGLARSAHPGLEVVTSIVADRPATALADASGEAGLVVVGARGRGSLGSFFLGSVSHATIHASSCPVVVVRRPDAP